MVNAYFKFSCNLVLIAALIEPPGIWGVRVQRKVFRVEQMIGKGRAQPQAVRATETTPDAAAWELALISETIAHSKRELMALHGGATEPRMTRAAYELGAAIDGMEKATQKILKCSEVIDENAKTLAATLKTGFERGLAQDIQEQTMRIYEACNFQDLAGQRVGKAIATLQAVEEHVTRMIALWDNVAGAPRPTSATHSTRLVNGPKLDGDRGHVTQSDIDAMFG
jgi:chemotaxis protein CheZ